MNSKQKQLRISRGYRLKRSTHDLIKDLQNMTGKDCDAVLESSCRMYYTHYIQKLDQIKDKNKPSAQI
ncbi:MAG: hypothetical protein JNK43_08455 [Ignavibacteria bacterium]|nr:hypothetical protein [Ignavibacteria bacterium]